MAKNNTAAKWVARAASTGGGRTYRGRKPVNFYGALVLIALVGIGSIVYSRHEYRAGSAAATTPPAVGTTWYAAYDIDICGVQQPPLTTTTSIVSAPTSATTSSFNSTGNGVIKISPKTTSVAGPHATFGRFLAGFHGLKITSTQITLTSAATTTASSSSTTSTTSTKVTTKHSVKTFTYKNGQSCAKGTPFAGKKATVQFTYWTNAFNSKGKANIYTGDIATLRFTNNQLVTIAFIPQGSKVPKPNGTVVSALVQTETSTSSSATTTPIPPGASSTTTSTTPTQAPGAHITTTTAASTTTTSKG